jgi:hypothetical protein
VAALAAVVLAATARLTPEAAVSRTLPAISVTVAGRACAKRMKRLPVLLVTAAERLIQYGMASYATYWTSSAVRGATRCPTPLTAVITAMAVIMPGASWY